MQSPFIYHQNTVSYFKKKTALWNFFAKESTRQEDHTHFLTELLKTTYRLEPSAEPAIYDAINKAKDILGITETITVYQLMQSTELNAFVYAMPTEAHIVLSGNILKLLDAQELFAVLAHELGHIKLFAEMNGDLRKADRLLNALASNADTPLEYLETDRLFDLYTELYCDQMALKVLNDPLPVISSLVKVKTGLEQVSAESYIRQSIEIFEAGEIKSENISHHENFIRAYGIHIFQTAPETFESRMKPVIQGSFKIRQLDVFGREALNHFSREIITVFINEKSLQTDILLNLAKQYFPGFTPPTEDTALDSELIKMADESTKEYISYLLLDFAFADPTVEHDAFKRAFAIADSLNVRDLLKTIVKKELKLTEKKFNDRYKKTLAQYA